MSIDPDQVDICKFDLNFANLASLSEKPKFGPQYPQGKNVPRRSSKNVWSRLLGDLYKPVTATPVTDMQRPSQRPIAKPDLESHSSSGVLTMEDDKVDVFKLPLESRTKEHLLKSNKEELLGLISESTSRLNKLVDLALDACDTKEDFQTLASPRLSTPPPPRLSKFAIFGILHGGVEGTEAQTAQQLDEIFQLLSTLTFDGGRHPVAEKPAESRAVAEVLPSERALPVNAALSRRQLEKLRVERLLRPSPQALADLNRRVALHKAEAQRRVMLTGSKIEQNIRRAKDYRRVAKPRLNSSQKVKPPPDPPSAAPATPVPDPLVAAAWRALILAARYPDLLVEEAGGLHFHC
eukprot:EG_transcript_14201